MQRATKSGWFPRAEHWKFGAKEAMAQRLCELFQFLAASVPQEDCAYTLAYTLHNTLREH